MSLGFTVYVCVFLFSGSICMPRSVSFHVLCSSSHPSSSLSLSGYFSLSPTCIYLRYYLRLPTVFFLFQLPELQQWNLPSSLLSNFCLISVERILSMFPIQTSLAEESKGGALISPLRCLPQQMSSLSFHPNAEAAVALKIACLHLLTEMCQHFHTGCLWVSRNALV